MTIEEPPPEVVQAARDAFQRRVLQPSSFALQISLAGSAFCDADGDLEPGPELARILHAFAGRLEAGYSTEPGPNVLLDANGNSVGSWRFE